MEQRVFIESVEVKNYRLCKDMVFSPKNHLSALIGPNGSGKTTILKSILLLKLLAREEGYRRRWAGEETSEKVDPTEIKVHLVVDGKKIIHRSLIDIDNDNANEDEIIHSKQTWNLSSITGSKKHVKLPVFFVRKDTFDRHYVFDEHYLTSRSGRVVRKRFIEISDFDVLKNSTAMEYLSSVADFYQKMTYYSASKFTNPSLCPVFFEIDEDRGWRNNSGNRDHTKWLVDLYKCYKERNNEFESFLNIVGKSGLGLIDNFTFREVTASKVDHSVRIGGKVKQKNKENILVVPQINMNKDILSPSQLSEGTFKTLGMIFYLMTGKNSLILLEEPEVCIHHGLLESVVELIKRCSQDKQVIVSTHSDFVLDSLEPSSVHVVKKDTENGISSTPLQSYLSPNDKSALKKFLATEGNLGEFWRHGGLDD